MIALTQKKREELIFQCKCMIKSFKASEVEHPSERYLSDAVLRQEIALAALTATPYGSCIVGALPNKTDSSANLYSISTAKLMADVGYELMPLFAAPPVPEIKRPDLLDIPDDLDLASAMAAINWYEMEIKRLNGIAGGA